MFGLVSTLKDGKVDDEDDSFLGLFVEASVPLFLADIDESL